MNPDCPYCQNPARYDLESAEELNTIPSSYQRDEETAFHRRIDKPVVLMGHRSRHPISAQPHFHAACQKPN